MLAKEREELWKNEDFIPNNPPYAYDTGSPHKRNDSRWQLNGPHIRSAENRWNSKTAAVDFSKTRMVKICLESPDSYRIANTRYHIDIH